MSAWNSNDSGLMTTETEIWCSNTSTMWSDFTLVPVAEPLEQPVVVVAVPSPAAPKPSPASSAASPSVVSGSPRVPAPVPPAPSKRGRKSSKTGTVAETTTKAPRTRGMKRSSPDTATDAALKGNGDRESELAVTEERREYVADLERRVAMLVHDNMVKRDQLRTLENEGEVIWSQIEMEMALRGSRSHLRHH
eukprot:m51a1_g2905 hypothetical protein (193) ;mRNA; r:483135-484136